MLLRDAFGRLICEPSAGTLKGLNQLYKQAVPPLDIPFKHRIPTIVKLLQEILVYKIEDVKAKVCLYGSLLTNLHDSIAINNCCDLNLYIDFSNDYLQTHSMGELYYTFIEELKAVNAPFISEQIIKRHDWHVPCIEFFAYFEDVTFSVNCSFGDFARQAFLSSKLLYAYLKIWEPARHLALFVRSWARLLNLTIPSYGGVTAFAYDLLTIHYLQQTNYLPILNDILVEFHFELDKLSLTELVNLPTKQLDAYCQKIARLYYGKAVKPVLPIGCMIRGFFRYFSFFDNEFVCQITTKDILQKEALRGSRTLVVRDPFTQKNVLRLRSEIFAYFQNSILFTAIYLCSPRNSKGLFFDLDAQLRTNRKASPPVHYLFSERTMEVPSEEETRKFVQRNADYVHEFEFVKGNFTAYPNSPVLCHCCGKSHCEKACALLRCFIPLSRRSLSTTFRNKISREIERIYREKRLSPQRRQFIHKFIEDLAEHLRDAIHQSNLSLTPFGSLVNGFGTNDCDLDLWMQCDDAGSTNHNFQNFTDILQKVANALKEKEYKNVIVILNAKVPIVKFVASDDIIGDISLSNSLALHNSRLLAKYCEFDERVPQLGIAIKTWARMFKINDASNGSISSYAYIIMMLYFLQRCDPPVIPFLQEVSDDNEVEYLKYDVDGHSVYFHEELDSLRQKYKNTQCVGELFYNFFSFYLNVFDFNYDVIQIRRNRKLTKLDKSWHCYSMCVEDPFDLYHNLTGGVKMQPFAHIIKCLKFTLNGILNMEADFQFAKLKDFVPEKVQNRERNLAKNSNGNNNTNNNVSPRDEKKIG